MKKIACAAVAVLTLTTSVWAGAVGGPEVRRTTIPENMIDTWTVTFVAGERATVSIVGDGGTNLDLYVYDERGNLIASSAGLSDRETCSWVPRWTGKFKIKVVNRDRAFDNDYSIAWN